MRGLRNVHLVVALALSIGLTPASLSAPPCVDYDEPYELIGVDEVGDSVIDISLDVSSSLLYATYAYLSGGYDYATRTLAIDVTDPTAPVHLDTFEQPGTSPPVALEHVTAGDGVVCGLVTDGPEDELHVGDAGNPAAISFVTMTVSGMSGTSAAAIDGGLLYLASSGTDPKLVVVDVSDPTTPAEVGRSTTGLDAAEIVVTGDVLYAGGGTTFWTLDIGTTLGTLREGDPAEGAISGSITLSHEIENIAQAGDRAYAAGEGTLTVIDVSDPSTPVERGGLTVSGYDMAIQGDHVVVGAFRHLILIDATDPDLPRVIGAVEGPRNDWWGGQAPRHQALVVDEPRLYAGVHYSNPEIRDDGEVHLYENLSPPDDAVISTLPTPVVMHEIEVAGSEATALDRDGTLHILDLSEPESPVVVGSVSAVAGYGAHARADDLACVVSRDDGLVVVDVSTPTAPAVVGADATEGTNRVTMRSGIAYTTVERHVRIVDLGVPSAPAELSRVYGLWRPDQAFHAQSVALHGDLLLVGTYDELVVIDVSSPTSPVALETLNVPGIVRNIEVIGDAAIIDGGTVDLSDPEHLIFVPHALGGPDDTTIIGNILYATDGSGFTVWNVDDPFAPSQIGRYTATTQVASALAGRGGLLLAAGGDDLTVFRPQCSAVGVGDAVPVSAVLRGKLTVSPSPARSTALVRLAGTTPREIVTGHVIDVRGRVVDEIVMIPDDDGHLGVWDIGERASGIYFVRLETAHGAYATRLAVRN